MLSEADKTNRMPVGLITFPTHHVLLLLPPSSECIYEEVNPQCGDNLIDISDCNGATGLASSWGVSTVLGFTTVAGLLVATFGFVV